MTLRHAAAVALVGWYLMVPPLLPPSASRDRWAVNSGAPLGQWETLSSHDTADACTSAAVEYRTYIQTQRRKNLAKYHVQPRDEDGNVAAADLANSLSQCVATDDPRLKEK
jgi:hypothetical protein